MHLNPAKIKLIKLFIDNPKKEFYLSQARDITKLSLDRTYVYLNFWSETGVISYSVIGRMKLYKLKDSKLTRALIKFLEVLDEQEV